MSIFLDKANSVCILYLISIITILLYSDLAVSCLSDQQIFLCQKMQFRDDKSMQLQVGNDNDPKNAVVYILVSGQAQVILLLR